MLLFRHIVATKGVTAVVANADPALSQIADQTVVMRDGYLEEARDRWTSMPDLIQHVRRSGRHGGSGLRTAGARGSGERSCMVD